MATKRLRKKQLQKQRAKARGNYLTRSDNRNKTSFSRNFSDTNMRALEGENNERKFELSFSSEVPYERWFGNEILCHDDGCVDLTRLNEIGVLLFNHNRDKVIGKVERAWIEDNRGKAIIRFDEDADSDVIFEKVKSGTLKSVSVGYKVRSWESVIKGKKSARGRFEGPCEVATDWQPYEISIVSVPADETVGVGRSDEEPAQEPKPEGTKEASGLENYLRQLQININLYL